MMTMTWPGEWKEIAAWTAGGLVLSVLCLAATFPYDALNKRLIAELTRSTGMEVRVTDWAVGLPLGIEWRQVTLTKPDWGPIQLASLETNVGIIQALGGGLGLDVVLQLDDTSPNRGLAKGTVTTSSFSSPASVTVTGQLQQVDLSKIVRPYVGHGMLNGNFSHRIDSGLSSGGALKGDGTWKAEATDLTIEHIPLGNGQTLSLDFTKVSAGLTCRDTLCNVTELKGDGLDGSFTGEGTITVQQPMQNSQVALTLTIIPGTGFASKAGVLGLPSLPPGTPLTVKIAGTLAQARIAL